MESSAWNQAGLLVLALGVKGGLFLLYHRMALTSNAKRPEIPYAVLKKGNSSPGAKKIVVTGGCGFLGRHIVARLVEEFGDKVQVVSFDAASAPGDVPGVTYIRGDINKAAMLQIAFSGAAAVVHTAALIEFAATKPELVNDINRTGTQFVAEACLEKDVPFLVHTSSASVVVGSKPITEPVKESVPLPEEEEMIGMYARSKRAGERLVRAMNCHVLKTVVVRPGGIFGAADTSVGLTDALLRPSGGIERDAAAQYPVVWVEDAARMYAVIVRKLLFPTPEDQAGPDVRGKVFHACGDPLSDALTWEHIRSGETQVGTPPAARAKVRGTPLATAIKVARINEWLGHKLGWMPFGKTTTYANVFFGSLNYPCDIRETCEVLGWRPTPWRTALARIVEQQAAATKAPSSAAGASKKEQ